ncbi:MAG: RNHCP domain-containing protein [Pseudomonas sp.]
MLGVLPAGWANGAVLIIQRLCGPCGSGRARQHRRSRCHVPSCLLRGHARSHKYAQTWAYCQPSMQLIQVDNYSNDSWQLMFFCYYPVPAFLIWNMRSRAFELSFS